MHAHTHTQASQYAVKMLCIKWHPPPPPRLPLLTGHLLHLATCNPPHQLYWLIIFLTHYQPPSSPSAIDWSRRPPLVRSTSETGGNPHTLTTLDPSLPCDCQYTAWSPHELSNHSVWTTAKTWGNEKLKKDGNWYKWFLWLYKASLEFYNFFINI